MLLMHSCTFDHLIWQTKPKMAKSNLSKHAVINAHTKICRLDFKSLSAPKNKASWPHNEDCDYGDHEIRKQNGNPDDVHIQGWHFAQLYTAQITVITAVSHEFSCTWWSRHLHCFSSSIQRTARAPVVMAARFPTPSCEKKPKSFASFELCFEERSHWSSQNVSFEFILWICSRFAVWNISSSSYARVASWAVSKVPSQNLVLFLGSLISATHLPQCLRLIPLNDFSIKEVAIGRAHLVLGRHSQVKSIENCTVFGLSDTCRHQTNLSRGMEGEGFSGNSSMEALFSFVPRKSLKEERKGMVIRMEMRV